MHRSRNHLSVACCARAVAGNLDAAALREALVGVRQPVRTAYGVDNRWATKLAELSVAWVTVVNLAQPHVARATTSALVITRARGWNTAVKYYPARVSISAVSIYVTCLIVELDFVADGTGLAYPRQVVLPGEYSTR